MKINSKRLALVLALPCAAFAHVIPDDVTVRMFVKPEGNQLHLLVRVPFDTLADVIFPLRDDGSIDLLPAEKMLGDAAKIWISDWVDVFEGGNELPKPQLTAARIAFADSSDFLNYERALTHLRGAGLPAAAKIFTDRAVLDVLFDYPIFSQASDFSIHSRLSRLGVRTITALQYLPPQRAIRTYAYFGDPGMFHLDPTVVEAALRFLPLGFLAYLRGQDYLLLLLCMALLFRRFSRTLPFLISFGAASSVTLVTATQFQVTDNVWLPVLFQTLIAISIVYLAVECIISAASNRTGPADPRPLTGVLFGLVYGLAFAFSLRPTVQFGGEHETVSIASYFVGIELAQWLGLALCVLLLQIIFGLGFPARAGSIFLAAIPTQISWHQTLDRAKWLSSSQLPWPAWELILSQSVLLWLSALVLTLSGLAWIAWRHPGIFRTVLRR